jgi:histidyl-tRNA synthetase
LDVEIFNDPSPHADAELILLLENILTELGLTGVVMNINSLGCPDCRPGYKDKLLGFLASKKELLCSDCQRRMDANPLRVLDCKVPTCREAVEGAPLILDSLCGVCRNHFDAVKTDLAATGVRAEVNPRLVRGLDYYSRTTFEALTGDLGAQNAVAGGGRYDGLTESLGGPRIPATGWAMGLERLVMLLSEKSKTTFPRPDLYLAALDEDTVRAIFPLVQELRRKGFRIETDYEPGSLKSRMRRAGKLEARRVLIAGPDELKSGRLILRDMETHGQVEVPLDGAGDRLAAALAEE